MTPTDCYALHHLPEEGEEGEVSLITIEVNPRIYRCKNRKEAAAYATKHGWLIHEDRYED